MRGVLFIVALTIACTTHDAGGDAGTCTVYFAGDVVDTSTSTGCASLAFADGAWTLSAHASSASIPSFDVTITIGASVAPGGISSDVVAGWSATATSNGDAGCGYTAGNADVPTGSFTLDLTSVDIAEASTSVAHGTLDVVLYVHAPPLTDCGQRDVENVELRF